MHAYSRPFCSPGGRFGAKIGGTLGLKSQFDKRFSPGTLEYSNKIFLYTNNSMAL